MRILTTCLVLLAMACGAGEPTAPTVTEVSREEFMRKPPGSYVILDVRTSEEYEQGHVKNALNISHDRLEEQLPQIQKFADAPVLLYCRSGRRAGLAAEVLAKAGFTKLNHLTGDMEGWQAAGLPVTKNGP